MKSRFLLVMGLLLGGSWYVQAGDGAGARQIDWNAALEALKEIGARCPVCNEVFEDEDARDEHVCEVIEEGGGLTTAQIVAINDATQAVIKEVKNTCMECGYIADCPSNLVKHQRTHTREKPYVCTWPGCGKAFAQTSYVGRHMYIHTGEKPFACEWPGCSKAFAQRGDLESHLYVHTGEKPFACEWEGCGKKFSQSGDLRRHERNIHIQEKPYVCLEKKCSQRFATSDHLITHSRVHTGERPFTCNYCNKSFSQQPSLKRHMYIHTGAKPYQCDTCNQKFSDMSNKNRHMRESCPNRPNAGGQ